MGGTFIRRSFCTLASISFLAQSCAHPQKNLHGKAPTRTGLLYSGIQYLEWPLKGGVSSYFGKRRHKWHDGLDIRARRGTKIRAAAKGQVIHAGYLTGYGQTVILRHQTFKTLYAHCNSVYVDEGDDVDQGETIATVGNSGNARGHHLHFEVRTFKWTALNPLNYLPLEFL